MNPYLGEILGLTLFIAFFASLLCLPFALGIGFLLERKNFKGKLLLDVLCQFPLVLPPVTMGFLLLFTLGRKGFIGKWLTLLFDWNPSFHSSGAILAAAIVGFPLFLKGVRLGFKQADPNLEIAAASLGLKPWQVFIKITFPLALPGIISGFVLCFARSLGEFGATLSFAGNIPGVSRTVSLEIYNLLQIPGQEKQVMVLGTLSILIAFLAIALAHYLEKKTGVKIASI